MSDDLRWLVSQGIGVTVCLVTLVSLSREVRALRREMAGAAEKQSGWNLAIFTRLARRGAESVPPPVAEEPRKRKPRIRIQTVPSGVPTIEDKDGDE